MCHQQRHSLISRHSTARIPDECGEGSHQPGAKVPDFAELFIVYELVQLEHTSHSGDSGRMCCTCALVMGAETSSPGVQEDRRFGTYQSAVLQVLSQKAVVIQGIFGFPCHPVNWPFVHLVFDSSKQHVKGLPNRILAWKEGQKFSFLLPAEPQAWKHGYQAEDTAAEPQ